MKSNREIVEELIIKNPKVQDTFNTITRGSKWKEDLYPEIINIYMKMDNDKLNELYDKGEKQFRYYFSMVVRNQLHSSTSSFYWKYRKKRQEALNFDVTEFRKPTSKTSNPEVFDTLRDSDWNVEQDHSNIEKSFEEHLYEIYQEIKWDLHWYERDLFDLYLEKITERGPYRRISEMTGIPEQSVGFTIRQVRDRLKKDLAREMKKRDLYD